MTLSQYSNNECLGLDADLDFDNKITILSNDRYKIQHNNKNNTNQIGRAHV